MTGATSQRVGRDPRIWVLAIGQFSVALGALVVVGILPLIARDLDATPGAVGQTVLGFGLATALSGPLLVGPTSRIDRRTLLAAGLAITALANLCAALATGIEQLMAARVLAGIGVGIYAPAAIATAGWLAPVAQRGRAVTFVFVGFVTASALGVPAGTLAAEFAGWRGTFLMIAGTALLAMLLIRLSLPAGLEGQPIGGKAWRQVLGSPVLVSIVAVSLLQVMGKSVLATYFAPALMAAVHASGALIALLLLGNGVASVMSNVISARFVDRLGAERLTNLTLAAALVPQLLFPFAELGLWASFALMILLGLLGAATASTQQARLIEAAPALAPATLALNVSANYLGGGLGAAAGALSLEHLPIAALGPVGAAILLVAIALSLSLTRRGAPSSEIAVAVAGARTSA